MVKPKSRRHSARRREIVLPPPAPIGAPVAHSKASRIEAHHREQHRRNLVRYGLLGVAALVVVVLLGWAAGIGQPDIGRAVRSEGGVNVHIPDGQALTYENRPPSSGPHYAARARYGLSATPIPAGNWVHVLEHGGTALLYKCEGETECREIGAQLRADVYERAREGSFGERKMVITPYQDMDAPIVAVAWDRVLELDSIDAEQILAFYHRYLDKGPEKAA